MRECDIHHSHFIKTNSTVNLSRNIPRTIPILYYPAISRRITRRKYRLFLLLVYDKAHHTPVVEEVAGPRNICQPVVLTAIRPSGVLQQLFERLPQSQPDISYLVINKKVDPKPLGSKNNTMKEAQQSHT